VTRVAFATCARLPDGAPDDLSAAALLGADVQVWDDPQVDWSRYDRIVVRSTWDYTARLHAFLAWCRARGDALRNPAAMIAWSADKRYLADLGRAGLPVVPTRFIAPGEAPGALPTSCVVKPAVSAGARRTGRFGPGRRAEARGLIDRITAAGDTALVQPFLEGVAEQGETTLVALGGAVSHVVRKRLVLEDEGEAPLDTSPRTAGAARVMYAPDLVRPSTATDAEHAVGDRTLAWLRATFGTPAYARIDLLPGADGEPLVGEVELIEPSLHLRLAPGAGRLLADAVLRG
jgi:hypothetical protein